MKTRMFRKKSEKRKTRKYHSLRRTKLVKRHNRNRLIDGGKVIGTGGFGCVFSPPLACANTMQRPSDKYVSKIMLANEAKKEYEESVRIEDYVKSIPNYQSFFNVGDMTMCDVGEITPDDTVGKTCDAVPIKNLIGRPSSELQKYKLLQQPNLGKEFNKYVKSSVTSYAMLSDLLGRMNTLLVDGIVAMNKLGLYHEDLKSPNILVQDNIPKIIDWGFAIKNDGPVIDDRTAGNKNVEMKMPMKAFVMFNAPLSGAYFLQEAWEGTSTGELSDVLENVLKEANEGGNVTNLFNALVDQKLEDFEEDGHFGFLRHNLLKPAMAVLKNNNVRFNGFPIPASSQVVFANYFKKLNQTYLIKDNGEWKLDREHLYKDFYHNIDLWGWAVTVGSVVEKKLDWATPEENNRIMLGASKLIYYLFSPEGMILDINVMTGFVNEMMAPGSPLFVYPEPIILSIQSKSKPSSRIKLAKPLGSKEKPRPASSRKIELFTPSGKLPKGMTNGLTKKGELTVAHKKYIKSLGKPLTSTTSKKYNASFIEKMNKNVLSPIQEGNEEPERPDTKPMMTGRTRESRRTRKGGRFSHLYK